MLSPIEIRCDRGSVLVCPAALVPPARRSAAAQPAALYRLFASREAVAGLRRAWAQLGLGGDHVQQLTAGELQRAVEQAVATHRLVLFWIAADGGGHAPLPIALPKTPARVPPPPLPGATKPAPPPRPVGSMSDVEKIATAFLRAPAYLGDEAVREGREIAKDAQALVRTAIGLKRWFAGLSREDEVMAGIAAFCGAIVIGAVVGEVTVGALLVAFGWVAAGVLGLRAALSFEQACHLAANARSEAELDTAAHMFAHAMVALGETFLPWLLARVPRAVGTMARGLRGAEVETAAMTAADRALDLKVTRPVKAYADRFIRSGPADAAAAEVAAAKPGGYTYDMLDPGPLPNNMAGTFAGGRYSEGLVGEGQTFYKAGRAADPGGSFFSPDPPTGILKARIDSAVRAQWIDPVSGALTGESPIDSSIAASFPAGTKYYYGPIASQGDIYVGNPGAIQIFVPDARQIGTFTVLGPLK